MVCSTTPGLCLRWQWRRQPDLSGMHTARTGPAIDSAPDSSAVAVASGSAAYIGWCVLNAHSLLGFRSAAYEVASAAGGLGSCANAAAMSFAVVAADGEIQNKNTGCWIRMQYRK
mmetsp:Transcript_54525/g.130042  ORF Transcript_54525/g.130042 Transcript_54525/m.130042 type:complete len:115 (+) Transcript_54525:2232-2576(+)